MWCVVCKYVVCIQKNNRLSAGLWIDCICMTSVLNRYIVWLVGVGCFVLDLPSSSIEVSVKGGQANVTGMLDGISSILM